MPFIEVPVGDVQIPDAVPEGEYELLIEDVTEVEREEERRTDLRVRMSVIGHPEAESVFENLIGIAPEDDEKKMKFKLRRIRGFLEAFGIDFEAGGFNTEDMIGVANTLALTQEEYKGRISNKLVYRW